MYLKLKHSTRNAHYTTPNKQNHPAEKLIQIPSIKANYKRNSFHHQAYKPIYTLLKAILLRSLHTYPIHTHTYTQNIIRNSSCSQLAEQYNGQRKRARPASRERSVEYHRLWALHTSCWGYILNTACMCSVLAEARLSLGTCPTECERAPILCIGRAWTGTVYCFRKAGRWYYSS